MDAPSFEVWCHPNGLLLFATKDGNLELVFPLLFAIDFIFIFYFMGILFDRISRLDGFSQFHCLFDNIFNFGWSQLSVFVRKKLVNKRVALHRKPFFQHIIPYHCAGKWLVTMETLLIAQGLKRKHILNSDKVWL